jgi:hypothetical protein
VLGVLSVLTACQPLITVAPSQQASLTPPVELRGAPTVEPLDQPGVEIPFEPLGLGSFHSREDTHSDLRAKLLIFAQADEIPPRQETLFAAVQAEIENVDYGKSFVVVAMRGWKGGGGPSLSVRRVVRSANLVRVFADFTEPSPGQPLTTATDRPLQAIAVRKEGQWAGQFTFELIVNNQVAATATHYIP